jgi:shikimate dehydrogenase
MHRAAYAALALDADYEVFDVRPEDLEAAMIRFRRDGLRQLAVSIPHKEAMLGLVDEVEPVARKIGAINTVTCIDDRLVGSNTDWIGALRAIERETTIAGKVAVVLGAGGAARAVVYGLRERGAQVHVLNRTVERARGLVRELGGDSAGALTDLPAIEAEILVNTTSVGLNEDRSPVSPDGLREDLVVLDAVYSPEVTRLLGDTQARGGRPIGGKWMLVYQAIEQLRRWTALLEPAPREAEFDALTEIMAEAFDEAGRAG